MNEAEIREKYKQLHDDLSYQYYKEGTLSKEDFDRQHGQIWNGMETELILEGYRSFRGPTLEERVTELEQRFPI